MNWQKTICPERVTVEESSNIYGKFVCEPLERGFGTTIGNALRRTLLSSLYGAAIVSVYFDSVVHEFSVIDNVVEDVSEIILNLKEVRLKLADPNPAYVRIEAQGERIVTAGDIICDGTHVEVLNPNLKIVTLNKNAVLKMVMAVRLGKGYALAVNNKLDMQKDNPPPPVGTIAIDSVFSPIKKVSYVVGNARIGQRTDYDKLTLEVWTDGSVFPEDAVAFSAKIIKEQMNPFINFDEKKEPEISKQKEDKPKKIFNENLYRSVDELELSVRSANCLKNADILKIYQLVQKTEAEMLKTKNFGRKSLNEIKEVLSEMDLSLGMKLDGFIIPEEEKVEKGE